MIGRKFHQIILKMKANLNMFERLAIISSFKEI